MSDMFSQTSTCRRPCVELRAKSMLRSRDAEEMQGVYLNFQKMVTVIKNKKAYGVFDLVVDIGSSLGLWMGLSALGVFDLALQAGEYFVAPAACK